MHVVNDDTPGQGSHESPPTERDYNIDIWIVDTSTVSSAAAPNGRPEFNTKYQHGWMSDQNLTAKNSRGVTSLSNPAGEWDEEEMSRPSSLIARKGTYPLGDFIFTRNEGSNDVAIALKEDGLQKLQIGRRKYEQVKRFSGSAVIDESLHESRKAIVPGPGSMEYIYPAMRCTFKVTTAASFTPAEDEVKPDDPIQLPVEIPGISSPLPFPIFSGPLPIPFGPSRA